MAAVVATALRLAMPELREVLLAGVMLLFVWFLRSLRCSACGTRVAWYVARKKGIGDFIRLGEMEACPACGDPGGPRPGEALSGRSRR